MRKYLGTFFFLSHSPKALYRYVRTPNMDRHSVPSANRNLPITRHGAFRRLSKALKHTKPNSTERETRSPPFTDGEVFNDLYKWSFDKKEDGRERSRCKRRPLIAAMTKRAQGGRCEPEMQHRLPVFRRGSISRYNATLWLGKIKAANWLTRWYCLFSHLDHRTPRNQSLLIPGRCRCLWWRLWCCEYSSII